MTHNFINWVIYLGYHLPWEVHKTANLSTFAKPLEILIEASNGCSDYGNKFGEPVICGFTRSFSLTNSQNQKIEYIKPILFSAGIGTVEDHFISKQKPAKGTLSKQVHNFTISKFQIISIEISPSGMKVVKIGGPVYRIGVGGGAASSTEVGHLYFIFAKWKR